MNIDQYKTLIANLPVMEQSSKTKRDTWKKAEDEFEWLKVLNNKLFDEGKTLSVSRQDIFDTNVPREVIIKTIYWGYPSGMRGNHLINILKYIDTIENTFHQLKQSVQLTGADFEKLTKTFDNIPGIKLSTYSKLLYFFSIKFNEHPCLILDQRIIDVIRSGTYVEFQHLNPISYSNAEKKYLGYLQITEQLSTKIETEGENIELFLFTFGNALKTTNKMIPKISNMWDGYCPESTMQGKLVRMRLNQHDFFESEETGLQICILAGVQAVILNFRGKGKFRETPTYGHDVENGEVLSPQNSDRAPFNNPTIAFGDASGEIESYIAAIL